MSLSVVTLCYSCFLEFNLYHISYAQLLIQSTVCATALRLDLPWDPVAHRIPYRPLYQPPWHKTQALWNARRIRCGDSETPEALDSTPNPTYKEMACE